MSENPDRKPEQKQESPRHLALPRSVSVDRSVGWLKEGFAMFRESAPQWVLAIISWFFLMLFFNAVPGVGIILSSLVNYVLVGGLMIGCAAQQSGQPFSVGYLLVAFRSHLYPLMLLSGIMSVLNMLIMWVVIGDIYWELLFPSDEPSAEIAELNENQQALFALLYEGLIATMPLLALSLFAPALIVFHEVPVLRAIQLSLTAILRNILSFAICLSIVLPLVLLAVLTFGFGFLVLMPTLICGIYLAYRDLFTQQQQTADIFEP